MSMGDECFGEEEIREKDFDSVHLKDQNYKPLQKSFGVGKKSSITSLVIMTFKKPQVACHNFLFVVLCQTSNRRKGCDVNYVAILNPCANCFLRQRSKQKFRVL